MPSIMSHQSQFPCQAHGGKERQWTAKLAHLIAFEFLEAAKLQLEIWCPNCVVQYAIVAKVIGVGPAHDDHIWQVL